MTKFYKRWLYIYYSLEAQVLNCFKSCNVQCVRLFFCFEGKLMMLNHWSITYIQIDIYVLRGRYIGKWSHWVKRKSEVDRNKYTVETGYTTQAPHMRDTKTTTSLFVILPSHFFLWVYTIESNSFCVILAFLLIFVFPFDNHECWWTSKCSTLFSIASFVYSFISQRIIWDIKGVTEWSRK